MIYTVECSFSDTNSEAEWNNFYSLEKLPALVSVRGFHSSQRLKALSAGCPRYLAMHTIEGLDVLTGEEYRRKGGGNFARWQMHITDWHRNLYDGLDRAPAVKPDEILAVSASGPQSLIELGLTPSAIRAVELEKFPAQRWLGKLDRAQLSAIDRLPHDIHVYEAMTAQLTKDDDSNARLER